jgi:hypothetical protein
MPGVLNVELDLKPECVVVYKLGEKQVWIGVKQNHVRDSQSR